MRYFVTLLLLLAALSCKRALSRSEVEKQLKKAMYNSLIKRPDYDSTIVKYDVKNVTFYEDNKFYDCEFLVHMWQKGIDTTGNMSAKISKDFSVVKRMD